MFFKRQEKIIAKNRIGTIKNIFKSFACSLVTSLCLVAQINFAFAQTAGILAQGVTQFFDNNGNPLSLGTVQTYIAGTSTPKTTWQDAGETVPNTNPINLDIAGRTLLYGQGTYREVVKDSNGNLIWDAVTQPIGVTVNQTLIGDGQPVGTVKPWAAFIAPNQYAFAYGQSVLRATYPDLFSAITITTLVSCSIGSAVLTGISDTTQIPIGAPVEFSCVSGATVIAKSSNSVTLSTTSLGSGTVTAVFFPWGNGNASTTFNIPDLRGVTLSGRPNMGGSDNGKLNSTYYGVNPDATGAFGGTQSTTLLQANLPNLTLTTTIGAGQGLHVHAAATGQFLESVASGGGGATPGAGTTATTNVNTAAATLPAMTGTTPTGGSGTAISLIQPTVTINYVIKITPDINASTANGVASLGGMTGVIACGTGLLCTGNTISNTITNWASLILDNTFTGTNTFSNTLVLLNGSSLNNQTTIIPNGGDADDAYTAFFNPCVNATAFPCVGGLASTGVIFNLNRVKVGEASLTSSDYLSTTQLPSTPSWVDTLFNQAIVGTSQLASGAALGTTGVTGYARTSDFYKYGGSASLGSQGGVFIADNDDTSGTNPIADAILAVGVQHSGGTGLTTLGEQLDINAATQVDIQAYATGGNPNGNYVGETIGALITSGAYNFSAAKPSAAINISYGGYYAFRKGIVVGPTALDQSISGCVSTCGIAIDLPGGGDSSGVIGSIRWSNPTPGVDTQIWGDGNGFNVNSKSLLNGQATILKPGTGAAQPTTFGDGLFLQNVTAAANGAQQNSPNIHFQGQGWKTASTAASQATDWFINVLPVQGSSAPTSQLQFSSSIGAGSVTTQFAMSSNGTLVLNQNVSNTGGLVTPGSGISMVGADGAAPGYSVISYGIAPGNNGFIKYDGTFASPTAVVSGDELGRIGFGGATSSSTVTGQRAKINAFAAENWSATQYGTYVSIFTTVTGGGSPSTTEKFRFQASGGLSIGNANIAIDPTAGGIVSNLMVFNNGGTEYGRLQPTSAGLGLDVNAGSVNALFAYTSGGTYFGATPADPGANNLQVQADMKAATYHVGATAGASCTLTTVSHLTVVNGIVTLCN